METMRIKKLELGLIAAIVADIIALIFDYPTINLGAITLASSSYNIIELVIRHVP
jgi:hypothetical protein